jgi:hypothetical protein
VRAVERAAFWDFCWRARALPPLRAAALRALALRAPPPERDELERFAVDLELLEALDEERERARVEPPPPEERPPDDLPPDLLELRERPPLPFLLPPPP